MKIKLNCPECDGTRFSYDEEAGDDAVVTCADCGHVYGTMSDVRASLRKKAVAAARKELSRAIGRKFPRR